MLSKFLKIFRISLGIFLLLSLLLSGCNHNGISWQSANKNSLRPLIKQALQENTTLKVDLQAKVAKINKNLFLINYNSEALCGYFGCLYSLYQSEDENRRLRAKRTRGETSNNTSLRLKTPHYQHLWSAYFSPYHPPRMPLFTVAEDPHPQGYPCLQFHQIEKKKYLDLTYCFNGKTYSLTDSRLFLKPIRN
jgi:hypothetical protein